MTIKTIRNFAFVLALAFALVVPATPAYGQTALTTTTLSTNITATQSTFNIASATGVAVVANAGPAQGGIGSPSSYAGSHLYFDQEDVIVTGLSSTTVTVRRGSSGTKAVAHVSGAKVYVAPSIAIHTGPGNTADMTGQCRRSTLAYVPYINASTGNMFDCLGVTTAGQWFQTNRQGGPFGLLGSTVTPATSITPTGLIFATDSGATTIATIVVPAGFTPGMSITIIPGGTGATTSSGGNIGLTTSAFVVGRAIIFTWSGVAWFPSYVS